MKSLIFMCLQTPILNKDVYTINQKDINEPHLVDAKKICACRLQPMMNLPLFPHATHLCCNYNYNLTSFNFSESLIYLDCTSCGISYLPKLPSLEHLNCSFNSLTELPELSSKLVYLNCIGNKLTKLPILPNTLVKLIMTGTYLTEPPKFPEKCVI